MVTTLTVRSNPKQTWQQQALTELEQSLDRPLQLWTASRSTGWSRQESPLAAQLGAAQIPNIDWSSLLDRAALNSEPIASKQSPGQYSLVIPLGEATAVTTTVVTENLDHLLQLASVSSRFFCQQEELTRLREENDFFLKQVSDDFEELTFLRSIAQRLGLGDSTYTVEQLVTASLPELGKSAHAEELYFIVDLDGELQNLVSWRAEGIDWPAQPAIDTRQLVGKYRQSDSSLPVIKNGLESTQLGEGYPGVRDIIIVPVGENDSLVGWFLAINRLPEDDQQTRIYPEWRLNQHEFGTSEASLLSTAAAMTASHANNLALFQEREILLVNVVRTLVSTVEAKDQYTCGHSERVALYGKRLARQMGYNEEACQLLYLTGLLHDVGKIAINDAILNKPDQLTNTEFAEIQRHPDEGWKILQDLQQLSYVLPGVLHHHERMDGKGYPDRLQGTDIPRDGRVLAVADAYDAMTSDRAYRAGMPHDKAISILREGTGTQWDAAAVAAFLEIEAEIISIRKNYRRIEKPNRKPTPVGGGKED